jgi:hypothetical protein
MSKFGAMRQQRAERAKVEPSASAPPIEGAVPVRSPALMPMAMRTFTPVASGRCSSRPASTTACTRILQLASQRTR